MANSFINKALHGRDELPAGQNEQKCRQGAALAGCPEGTCATEQVSSLAVRPPNATTKYALMHQICTNSDAASSPGCDAVDTRLQVLITVWPSLHESVRSRIMTMIENALAVSIGKKDKSV